MNKKAGTLFIVMLLTLTAFLTAAIAAESNDYTSPSQTLDHLIDKETFQIPTNSFVYAADNDILAEWHNDQNRLYTKQTKTPEIVKQAFLSTEDQQFFEHKGLDASAVLRAVLANANAGSIEEGASTITQQLARNLFLHHGQTYERKIAEVLYAVELENEFSKAEILEMYINTIYFNRGIYGFETASQSYFSKSSSELNLGETAFLAAIPANPTYYDPVDNKENTIERQGWILQKLLDMEHISEDEYAQALDVSITVTEPQTRASVSPDYEELVKNEFRELVAEKEGYFQKAEAAAENDKEAVSEELDQRVEELIDSGIHIYTHFDSDFQDAQDKAAGSVLQDETTEAASVTIDHVNHKIIAAVGGRDYQSGEFHRAFQAYRQPGSTIKPLLVYAPYIDTFEASSTTKIDTKDICINEYCVSQAGTTQPVSLKQALAASYNTSAVRLFEQTGISESFSYLESFSFANVTSADQTPASSLGGFRQGVSPLELTNAYTAFSNQGAYIPARAISSVQDEDGRILYEWKDKTKQVWSEQTNQEMRILLKEVMVTGTGTEARINAESYGGKTGTTNEEKDLWFAGYNERYTTAVWIGKDQPASLSAIEGEKPALVWWKQVME